MSSKTFHEGNAILGKVPPRPGAELRCLEGVFRGQYLPSLSINYVAIDKDLENWQPQLYKLKKKIRCDWCYSDIGVVRAKKWRHYLFYLQRYFSALGGFFEKNRAVWAKSTKALPKCVRMKFIWLEIR